MLAQKKEYQRNHYQSPFVATDAIIEYNNGKKSGIVLITRKNPPYGYALPGGFLEYELSPGQNTEKEVNEETGLEVKVKAGDQPFLVRGNPKRDPRARILSLVYIVQGEGELKAGDDAATANLYSIEEVKRMLGKDKFAFDHEEIITQYLKHRRYL